MKKLKCSVCGAEWMLPDEVVLKNCPNPDCLALLDEEGQNDHWAYRLSQDINHWYVEGFNYFPSVIAHEYWRLRELFKQRKVFAACFQLRDVMESVLKYEVLAICAWANVNEVQDFQEEIGCQITTRNMSFGSWKALAELIRDFFAPAEGIAPNLPEVLSDALKGVINQYGPFVHWRNENIGHGALGLEEDEDFQKELTEMVDRLRDLFRYRAKRAKWSVGEALCQQPLYLEGQILIGYDKAEQLEGDGNALRIVNTSEGFNFAVSPYILLSEGTIFFFDNQKDKNKTERQSYVTGKRQSENEPFFTRLMQLNTSADCALDIASSMRIQAEDELLNRLDLEPRFIKPEYLFEWLRGNLEKYDKGVFLLKMPRGTGKSTFTEKLNCLYEGPERLDNDLDVRTYHISRSQMIRQNDFTQHIEEQWAHDYDAKKEWMRYKHIRDYVAEGYEPAEALCAFLKECLKFTQSRRYKQQIMLVVDGLDEIDEQNLWDYLPTPDQLPENVYLLLTSRDPETEALPERTVEKLSALRVTEQLRVNPEGDGNRDFLKIYIRAHISEGKRRELHLDNRDFETLMQIAEYHVLPLGMLCKLVEAGVPLQLLPDPGKQIEKYIDMLFESYGEKESIRLRELISVLCSIGAEEPISIHEIAWLLNNGMVSLGLLGMMNDLEPLLHIQRGYMANGRLYLGENRYTPSNIIIATAIRELVPESNDYIYEELLDTNTRINDIAINNSTEFDNDKSEMPINTSIIAYAAEFNLLLLAYENEEILSKLYLNSSAENKLRFIQNISNYLNSNYTRQLLQLSRTAKAYDNLIRWIESLDGDDLLQYWNIYVTLHFRIAMTLNSLGRYHESLAYCNSALDYTERTLSQNRKPKVQISLLVDLFTEITISQFGDDSTVLSQYYKEVTIIEKCEKYLGSYDRIELECLYSFWILKLSGLSELPGLENYEEALRLYENLCSIWEEMQAKGQPPKMIHYVEMNKEAVKCMIKLNRFEEALSVCEKELDRIEHQYSQDLLVEQEEIVSSYCIIAEQYQSLGKAEEAVELCERAYNLINPLEYEKNNNQEYLASVFFKVANVFHSLECYEMALTVYNRAKDIFEKLDSQGVLSDKHSLPLVYKKIADQLYYLKNNKDALSFYLKARLYYEKLDSDGLWIKPTELIDTYCAIAQQLRILDHDDEALAILEKAKEIVQELDTAYPLYQLHLRIIERSKYLIELKNRKN